MKLHWFLLLLFLAQGCSSLNPAFRFKVNQSTSNKDIEVSQHSPGNIFTISNNSNEPLILNYSRSYMVYLGTSFDIFPGDTRVIDTTREIPNDIIAPNSNKNIVLLRRGTGRVNNIEMKSIQAFFSGDFDKLGLTFEKNKGETISREINNIVLEQDQREKLLCYGTIIFYGGYCWYSANRSPTKEEYRKVEVHAEQTFDDFISIDYLEN